MTSEYLTLLKIIKDYINDRLTTSDFVNTINEFYYKNDNKVYNDANENNLDDELSILTDIYELVDRYDSSQAVVDNDSYCINEEELKQLIKEMLPRIENPVYTN